MKSLKTIFSIFILFCLLSTFLIGCNTGEQKINSIIKKQDESLQSNNIYFDYPMRDYPIGSSNNDDLYWDCSQNDFGNYLSEYSGNIYNGYHPGEDWSLPGEKDNGLRIYSIGVGKVIAVQNLDELGYLIVIEHEGNFNIPSKEINSNDQVATYEGEIVNKIYSVYLHLTLAKVNGKDLKVGDKVDENTIIGYIMNPGGGSHLHFEIRKNNDNHDKSWSLIGDKSNWQIFPDDGYNGYYRDLQQMVDSGLRDPSDFIEANKKVSDTIESSTEITATTFGEESEELSSEVENIKSQGNCIPLGEYVEYNGLRVGVNYFEVMDSYKTAYGEVIYPSEGGKFIWIYGQSENVGRQKRGLACSEFFSILYIDTFYHDAYTSDRPEGFLSKMWSYKNVFPGVGNEGSVRFVIPEDAKAEEILIVLDDDNLKFYWEVSE